jgi:hypothetical protein
MELKEALVIVLTFLVPLTIYCLVLALINRRSTPLVVSGSWDFLGIVCAVSGFLVAGGPAVVSNLTGSWHGFWLNAEAPGGARVVLLAVLLAYFLLVATAVVLVVRARRATTSVYNVEPEALERALGHVLDTLGCSWARSGNRYYLRVAEPVPTRSVEVSKDAIQAPGSLAPEPTSWSMSGPLSAVGPQAILDLEPFAVMRHVTLRWTLMEEALRQEVEGELTRGLTEVHTRDNPVSGWFLSATVTLFIMILCVLLLLLANRVLFPH